MQTYFPKYKILVCLLLLCGALQAATDRLDFEIAGNNTTILIGPDHKDLTLMTSADRAEVLRHLRLGLDNPDEIIRNQAEYVLLLLNDDETILRLLNAYHAGDYSAELGLSGASDRGNIAVLPYLIDDIYNGPTKDRSNGDALRASIRDKSALMVLTSIRQAPLLPPETRAWARQAFVAFDPVFALPQIKAWWAHNKEAILTKQYDKATWLPAGKIEPMLVANAPLPPAKAAPHPQPEPEPTASFKWLVAAVVLAIALGLRFLRKK